LHPHLLRRRPKKKWANELVDDVFGMAVLGGFTPGTNDLARLEAVSKPVWIDVFTGM
jgi:hypothetical protein